MAKRLVAALEPHEPFFIEEPVLPEHNDALPVIAAHAAIPIATGERMFSRWDFKEVFEDGHVDLVQPDLSHAGGITEVKKIAAMAETYDVAMAPHCPLGPIALASCIQVDACSPNALIQEQSLDIHYNETSDVLDYLADPAVFEYREGYVDIPRGPGLGLEELLGGYSHRGWQSVEDETVRFALIGLGWWTIDQVLPALEDADLCTVTVLVSGSAKKAERIATEWETVERTVTYDEFHASEAADAYDAVYICTPNAFHLEYAETAADLGKAVLCEKPMEATVERARNLVEACEDADAPLMVGYRMQTDPIVRYARDLVRSGAIGRPVHVLGNNSQTLLDIIPDPDQWRLNPDLTGYGTSVMDLGIYPLNTTRFLLESDPIQVQATMESDHEAFADVPDERSAFTVTFDGGVSLIATASQNAHSGTSLRIVGTEGELLFEPAFHMETDLRIHRDDDEVAVELEGVNQMTELFDYFADRVLSGTDIGSDGRHGLLDMEAMRAIYEASRSGRTVDLDRA